MSPCDQEESSMAAATPSQSSLPSPLPSPPLSSSIPAAPATYDMVSVDLQLSTSGSTPQDNKNLCGPQGPIAEKLTITRANSEANLHQAAAFPCFNIARTSAFRPLQQNKVKQQIEGILLNHRIAKVHGNETATCQEQTASFSSQGKTESAPYHVPLSLPRSTSNGQLTAQLTIFYSGTIHVYDDVPADKAHAIMLLAAGSSNPKDATPRDFSSMPFTLAARPACMSLSELKQQQVKRSHTELPFARKASLARFLEKRKDRIQTKGPFEFQKADDNNDSNTVYDKEEACGPTPEPKRLRPSL